MTHYRSIDDLEAAVGAPAQTSDWMLVDQQRINLFADATGDHQWIHVDAERAASGPYGSTIAHGYLTLSLVAGLLMGLNTYEGTPTLINYGVDKVRFLNPVRVDSRVRAHVEVAAVERIPGGARLTQAITIEIEGVEKPAAAIQSISLVLMGDSPSNSADPQ
jgi:acyl dehydratase